MSGGDGTRHWTHDMNQAPAQNEEHLLQMYVECVLMPLWRAAKMQLTNRGCNILVDDDAGVDMLIGLAHLEFDDVLLALLQQAAADVPQPSS